MPAHVGVIKASAHAGITTRLRVLWWMEKSGILNEISGIITGEGGDYNCLN